MQRLLGDVAILSSVFEEISKFPQLSRDESATRALQTRCLLLDILRRLSSWEDRRRPPDAEAYGIISHTQTSAHPSAELLAADVQIHQRAFRILCLDKLIEVEGYIPDRERVFEMDVSDRRPLAIQIYQNLGYLLHDRMKLYGPASALFPLATACNVLKKEPTRNRSHITCCRKLFDRIHRKGFSQDIHLFGTEG
jgi:hypothetical protein